MYYNKENIRNLKIKANNCYLKLEDYRLDYLIDIVNNRYNCNSVLRNIIVLEVNNIKSLVEFLKEVLTYQIKIIETEEKKLEIDDKISNYNLEIENLEEQVMLSETSGNIDVVKKNMLNTKVKERNNLLNDSNNLKINIANMKNAFTSYKIPDISNNINRGTAFYGVLEVDISILENTLTGLKNLYNKFESEAYKPYVDSDITEYFEGYAYKVDDAYRLVLDCLNKLIKILDYYINDSISLERALTKKTKGSSINNSLVAAIINKMDNLESVNLRIRNMMNKSNNNLRREKEISEKNYSKVNRDNTLNEYITKSGGKGRREAVVAAASYLSENEKVPYYEGGSSNSPGVNSEWGSNVESENKEAKPYGLDSQGFIDWAITNGGYKVKEEIGNIRDCTLELLKGTDIKAGDLLLRSDGLKAIITDLDRLNNKIKVAFEDPKKGMSLKENKIDDFYNKYKFDKVILMDEFYDDDENIKGGIDNED